MNTRYPPQGAMVPRWITILSILLASVPFSDLSAQKLSPKVTSFTPDDYNAHDQIFCSLPLSKGRTAFGTAEKILIHDGENFRHVPVGAGKPVFSMDTDSAGRIFIGGSSTMGVAIPDSSGELIYRSLIPLLPDSLKDFRAIWKVICDSNGGVYFNAQDQLLFRYHKGSIETIEAEKDFFKLHDLPSGPVIEDDDTGLFRIRGKDKVHLKGSKELTQRRSVHSLLPSYGENGKWHTFTLKEGIFQYDPQGGEIRALKGGPKGGWSSAKINTACRLDPGSNPYGAAFAVATSLKGIYLLSPQGKILKHLDQNDGIPAKGVWDLSFTNGGNLWAATNNGIALVHTGLPFTFAWEGEKFSGGIKDIAHHPSSDASIFLGTSQGAWTWSKENERFSRFRGTAGQCWDLLSLEPRKGKTSSVSNEKMLATGSRAIFSLTSNKSGSNKEAKRVLKGTFRAMAPIPDIKEGKTGILIGGRGGLLAISERAVLTEEAPAPLLSIKGLPEDIFAVGTDRSQDSIRLWASLPSKGVLKVTTDTTFSGYNTTFYDTSHGLPKGKIAIIEGSGIDGKDLVFGTHKGSYTFQKDEFVPYCRFGKSFCNGDRGVYDIKKGKEGKIWVLSGKGGDVQRFIPKQKGFKIDSTVFRVLNIGDIRSVLPKEGVTWLGGNKGLACFYPEMERDHERAWDCTLREVLGAGDSVLFKGTFFQDPNGKPDGLAQAEDRSGGIAGDSIMLDRMPLDSQPEHMTPTLPYSKNRMEFEFAAVFRDQQEAVRYSYKLAGFDTAWSKWTDKTKKEYTSLPEGDYTFKVKAQNVYLHESSTAKYRFTILPPWYRTWIAYSGYSVAGIGLIWLIVWLNGRRLIAQKQRLEAIVSERTKEIREEKAKVEEQQKETQKQKEKVEEAHKEITQSIDYAQKIQFALLQSEEQVSMHLPEHFILFKPQSQVSGDFYWAREHKGHLYFAAVDCTGHGVPGAFMSMLGISQLNEIMNKDELLTPGDILTELRERVVRELSGSDPEQTAKDGMDAAMVRIPLDDHRSPNSEPQDRGGIRIQFAGAQNPLYVVRKGIGEDPKGLEDLSGPSDLIQRIKPFKKNSNGIEIKGDTMPVGHDEHAFDAFTTISFQAQKGDMLYLFSDGYADQFGGPKGKKFRYGPFKQLLTELHERAVEEQKQELDRTFEDWKAEGQQEQIDDVVVIGIRL